MRDSAAPVRVEVLLEAGETLRALASDARAGLSAAPKELPPKWFYDERGSELFDEITRLPEYYLTRCERAILAERAADVAAMSGADTLVELGSGTSEKTRLLLDALCAAGTAKRFVPLDVSEPTLRTAARRIAARYPVEVHAVVGDFERHLGALPAGGRRLVLFLGSTIGNLPPQRRAAFLRSVAGALEPGESLLLGADLVKDAARLVAAYDDSRGVTADFNRNVLRVINRDLGARFEPERFAHVARWDGTNEWMEMHLRSDGAHAVEVPGCGLEIRFEHGEEMRTEISAKFRRECLESELSAAGFEPARWWTDGDFAVSLSFRR